MNESIWEIWQSKYTSLFQLLLNFHQFYLSLSSPFVFVKREIFQICYRYWSQEFFRLRAIFLHFLVYFILEWRRKNLSIVERYFTPRYAKIYYSAILYFYNFVIEKDKEPITESFGGEFNPKLFKILISNTTVE